MQEEQTAGKNSTLHKCVPRFDLSLFFWFDISPQFMFYQHEEFTSYGYKNGLYIFFYRSLFLRETLTRRREGKKIAMSHKETGKQHERNQQPQEPGCGGFTGRDAALLSPAARPISMSPSASSCWWWW